MKNRKLKIAVVGWNLSALRAVAALKTRLPEAEISCFLNAKDPDPTHETAHSEMLTCLPEQLAPEFQMIGAASASIFSEQNRVSWFCSLDGKTPVSMETLRAKTQHSGSGLIPDTLFQKLLSFGIWNDLTPVPWISQVGINMDWIHQEPESSTWRKSEAHFVVSCRELRELSGFLPELDEARVLGLDGPRSSGRVSLVFNAPHEALDFDAVLWTSRILPPQSENIDRYTLKLKDPAPLGRWHVWTTRVPYKWASYMPQASLWFDQGRARQGFAETALLGTQVLSRVYCKHLVEQGQTILQIEHPEFFDNPLDAATLRRPDAFLWSHLPFLEKASAESFSLVSWDEGWIMPSARPEFQNCGRGLDLWRSPKFGNLGELLDKNYLWPQIP